MQVAYVCVCLQAPSPCALDRTAAWLLNMNSASSYGETEDDRHDEVLIEKVKNRWSCWHWSLFFLLIAQTSLCPTVFPFVTTVPAGDCDAAGEVASRSPATGGVWSPSDGPGSAEPAYAAGVPGVIHLISTVSDCCPPRWRARWRGNADVIRVCV